MVQAKPRFLRLLLVGYALVLSVEGGTNVWINFIGKGRTWDLYPLAQAFWVACSVVVVIVLARTSASSVEPRLSVSNKRSTRPSARASLFVRPEQVRCLHHHHARLRYCPDSTLIRITSPISMNGGTRVFSPVSRVASFCWLVAVAPLMPGGVSVTFRSTVFGNS